MGFTKVPNKFLDFWLSRLKDAELRVWLFGWRQTEGWGKEEDTIAVRQIAEGIVKTDGSHLSYGTGLKRRAVFIALKGLESKGLAKRFSRPGRPTKYRFLCPEPVHEGAQVPVHVDAHGGARGCTPPAHAGAHTKEIVDRNLTKESKNAKTNGVSFESERRKTTGNFQATLADGEAFRKLMFEVTGKTEKVETALRWLRQARRAEGWWEIERVLREKLASNHPRSNAWFETVLENEFGLSPDDRASQESDYTQRYREAIRAGNHLEAQRCAEEAGKAGVSVLRSI